MAYGEFQEIKRYVVVSRQDQTWRYGYSNGNPATPKVKILKAIPSKRAWNDFYFPITIKIPMFFEGDTPIEVEVPPLHEGDAIAAALQEED